MGFTRKNVIKDSEYLYFFFDFLDVVLSVLVVLARLDGSLCGV